MHKIIGEKREAKYLDRKGAYLIPVKGEYIGVVLTEKGYFLLGGGIHCGESDEACIQRECLEEIGYTVSIERKLCSGEMYYKSPSLGYFHPIQSYYLGELLEKAMVPTETNHQLVWINYKDLKNLMYLEIQNWAIEQAIKEVF